MSRRERRIVIGMEAAGPGADISPELDCQNYIFHLCDLEDTPNFSVPGFPHRWYCIDRSHSFR